MAYDWNKLYNKAIELIESDEDVIFIQDVPPLLGVSERSFYDNFPADSQQMQSIKDKLLQNKSLAKKDLRKDFKKGSSAEKIALYKLMATQDELRALGTEFKNTTKDINYNVSLQIQIGDVKAITKESEIEEFTEQKIKEFEYIDFENIDEEE